MIVLQDLLEASGGRLAGPDQATQFPSFAYDSRRLQPGQLFIAVQTATGDGHDYIGQAVAAGADGVLCQFIPEAQQAAVNSLTVIIVSDTKLALRDYARFILRKHGPTVIGVTGTNGKSTAKEAIAAVLSARYRVFKNFGSYNGRYGLPIALGELEPTHEMAVLEMACDSFGEVAEMAALTRPQIGVMTTVSQAHLAGLGSVENVALEKGRLIEQLPADGTAILNADDVRVARMRDKSNAPVLSYGLQAEADIRAVEVETTLAGTRFVVLYQGRRYAGQVKLLGTHQLYPILAALAVGVTFNIPIEQGLAHLATLSPLPGRLNLLPGVAESLILDDSFNASPASMRAALDTLVALGTNHPKIAILGRMADLGNEERAAHVALGTYLVGKVDRLIGVGDGGQQIVAGALQAGLSPSAAQVTYTVADALQAVQPYLQSQPLVLVKASAEARLERVVQRLLAAQKANQVQLSRSDPGWEKVRIGMPRRPTWVEIDLEALGGNVRILAALAAPAKLMAILKADAYGHGAVKVARTALGNGAASLGVATVEEGIVLRQMGIEAPILVLGYVPAWQASDAIRHRITATVFNEPVLQAFSEAARRLQATAQVHIKIDTGMGRLGLLPSEVVPFMGQAQQSGIHIEGLFTHFARADEADLAASHQQLCCFEQILAELTELGLRPPLVHAANTAAIINLPAARFDMVRAGIGLYGLAPAPDTPLPPEMKPVLSFKTTIAQVKSLPTGSPIGYGATYHTQGPETIAIIPVGYADGFRRSPQTWGEVLVKGQRAPLVGRVSMDQSAINVSHIPNVRQGDEVVLIGQQGQAQITAEEVATQLGTINYEVVSEILARVPRMT